MNAVPIAFPSYLMPVDHARHETSAEVRPLLPEPLPAFLMRLLTRVEGLRGASRVALVMPDGEELAALLIQNGNICYVERSLACTEATALLAEEDAQVLALIGRLTHAAQGRFTTLSSLLRDIPPILVVRVREFLLSHAVRGILGFAWQAAGIPIELRPTAHYSGAFDPELSFSPVEVYLRAVRTLDISSRDLSSALFDQLADEFDLALILDQEVDGAFYPVALRASDDLWPTLRLTGLSSQLGRLEHSTPLERIDPCLSSLLAAYSVPDGTWLLVRGPRRRAWFHLAGANSLPHALQTLVPRLEAAL